MPAGKVDAVVLRAVESVDRGRGHAPFGFVRRLADLLDALVVGPLGGAHGVAEEIVARNRQLAVIAPLLGRPHIVGDGLQLGERGLLGLFGHPGQRANVLGHGLFQRIHQLRDLRLGVRAEGRARCTSVPAGRRVAGPPWPRSAPSAGAALWRRKDTGSRNRKPRSRRLPEASPRSAAADDRRSTRATVQSTTSAGSPRSV